MIPVVCFLIQIYLLAIFGRALLSWFPLNPDGVMATVGGFLNLVTDPVMKPGPTVGPTAAPGGVRSGHVGHRCDHGTDSPSRADRLLAVLLGNSGRSGVSLRIRHR